jgi:hypothetical protein
MLRAQTRKNEAKRNFRSFKARHAHWKFFAVAERTTPSALEGFPYQKAWPA